MAGIHAIRHMPTYRELQVWLVHGPHGGRDGGLPTNTDRLAKVKARVSDLKATSIWNPK